MKISFEGYGENAVTFKNSSATPAVAGKAAAMTGNGEVGICTTGKPAGIAISADSDYAVIQTAGFVTCTYSGTAPTVGWCNFTGATGGAVEAASAGLPCLVVEVDTTAKTVGFIL